MAHDFKAFPELTNSQMNIYYFDSPHRQITEPFNAKVVKVSDGDTIRVRWDERDFDFPVRLSELAAPEMNEMGGVEAQRWMSRQILGKEVEIVPSRLRVEKWGRLLAAVWFEGLNMAEELRREGLAISWAERGTLW